MRYDLAAVKQRLTMPILCMVGEQDTLINPDIVKALASALPNSRLRTVPGSGHSIYFENAAGVQSTGARFFIGSRLREVSTSRER